MATIISMALHTYILIYDYPIISQMIPVLVLDTILFVVVSQWPCVHWFSATDQSVLVHDRGPQHGVRTGLQWQQPRWPHLNNGVQESHPHRPLPRLQVPRTIHWPTNWRWSRHCTAGQEHCAQIYVTAKDQETWQALINNGYLRGVLQQHATPARPRPTDDQTRGLVATVPYVRGLSEAVWRVLAPLGLLPPKYHLRQLV